MSSQPLITYNDRSISKMNPGFVTVSQEVFEILVGGGLECQSDLLSFLTFKNQTRCYNSDRERIKLIVTVEPYCKEFDIMTPPSALVPLDLVSATLLYRSWLHRLPSCCESVDRDDKLLYR